MPPIDFASPEFLADPYPGYSRLRSSGPLLPLMPGVWLAGGYRAAERILRDRRFGRDFALGVARRYGTAMMDQPAFRMVGRFLLLMNPPEHTRLRSLLGKAFGVKQAAELRRLAAAEATRLLFSLAERREADLVTAFNYPLPIAVICTLLDLGMEDRPLFERQTAALVKVLDMNPLQPNAIAAANEAAAVFEGYFRDLLKQRRNRAGADLVSVLLRTEEDDERLSEDEIIANIVLLFLAGHETTANQLGNTLHTLSLHPHELAGLREDRSLIPGAVEECLRYQPAVHIAARGARRAGRRRDRTGPDPARRYGLCQSGFREPRRGGVRGAGPFPHRQAGIDAEASRIRRGHPLLLGCATGAPRVGMRSGRPAPRTARAAVDRSGAAALEADRHDPRA